MWEIGGRGAEALCISMVRLVANEQEWGKGYDFQNIMKHRSFGELGRLGFGKIVAEAVAAVRSCDEADLAVQSY